jgi:hypothetical protein
MADDMEQEGDLQEPEAREDDQPGPSTEQRDSSVFDFMEDGSGGNSAGDAERRKRRKIDKSLKTQQ